MLASLALAAGCSAPPDEGTGTNAAGTGAASPAGTPRTGPAPDLESTPLDPPALPGALAPRLTAAPGGATWASWIETGTPVMVGDVVEDETGEAAIPTLHRLRAARFADGAWSRPVTVATATPDRPFFANWADLPSVTEGEGGELLAHWLAKTGDDVYAYGIFLARSTDGGATWQPLGTLHDDDTPTEHGFVSVLPRAGGGFRAFWLDGRAMVDGEPMALRTATVVDGVVAPETGGTGEILDDRVCECCRTSAADVGGRPLVVYRDRSPAEVRDIFAVRLAEGGTSPPAAVHHDGWRIAGCPVNGPVVAAREGRTVVAWFTAAGGTPRVRAAFSADGGATFGAAVELTEPAESPLGRVDAALLADGTAVVSWLAGDGALRLRRVAADGTAGPPRRVARTSPERAGGFPHLEVGSGDGGAEQLRLAWTDPEAEGGSRIRFATLPAARLTGVLEGLPAAATAPSPPAP